MAAADKGGGNQMFTCIRPELVTLGPNEVQLKLTMSAGYSPCPRTFLMTQGSLADMPVVLGLPPSLVRMSPIPDGISFDITFPSGGGTTTLATRKMTM